jgi:hypothetical protein
MILKDPNIQKSLLFHKSIGRMYGYIKLALCYVCCSCHLSVLPNSKRIIDNFFSLAKGHATFCRALATLPVKMQTARAIVRPSDEDIPGHDLARRTTA